MQNAEFVHRSAEESFSAGYRDFTPTASEVVGSCDDAAMSVRWDCGWKGEGSKKTDALANDWRRFTAGLPKGFDTADLRQARALLEELS